MFAAPAIASDRLRATSARGCAFAHATMFFESWIASPSSSTRTGTHDFPVSRLTSLRPLVRSGSGASP